jgi:hypothetical protein
MRYNLYNIYNHNVGEVIYILYVKSQIFVGTSAYTSIDDVKNALQSYIKSYFDYDMTASIVYDDSLKSDIADIYRNATTLLYKDNQVYVSK